MASDLMRIAHFRLPRLLRARLSNELLWSKWSVAFTRVLPRAFCSEYRAVMAPLRERRSRRRFAPWIILALTSTTGLTLSASDYFPPPDSAEGWRTAQPAALGVDEAKLNQVRAWHHAEPYAAELGAALLVVYKGHLVVEDYVTGQEGGPQPWTAGVCNDIKSSTKSVFGTAAGVFLEEFKTRVTLDSPLVGTSRESSLISQIWDQPLTDPRKQQILVRHVLSMTSGHPGVEPWWQDVTGRHRTPGYSGAFQMYEYCFGWWYFDRVPSHRTLLFDPGSDFYYSNFGLEQFALAMRNISGELVGPYVYDRVLGKIGLPREVRENRYTHLPYQKGVGFNFSPQAGWAVGGSTGCDAYRADGSRSPYGFNTVVGSTLRITARDFARLGYLWLRKGRWGDAQLVPEHWMELATRRHVRADGTSPKEYGYTFWIYDQVDGVPPDTFATHGDRCNDSYIIPSLDLVVIRQGNMNVPDRAATRQALIRKLVAAFPRTDRLPAVEPPPSSAQPKRERP